jgi:hypothetical protein
MIDLDQLAQPFLPALFRRLLSPFNLDNFSVMRRLVAANIAKRALR